MSSYRNVSPSALNFSGATPVISGAQKFVVPVPAFQDGGEKLVYPEGEKAGQPIVDWQGKPIGESGVVFFNEKDSAWQAATGDGTSVVIINQVSEEQAKKLHARYQELSVAGPDLASFKAFLDYAATLGLRDMYNSDRKFVGSKMTPVLPAGSLTIEGMFGYLKRDDRDICHAIFIAGALTFEGPAATPQVFNNGAVVVQQGKDVRGIQPDIFMETYRLANGTPVSDFNQEVVNYTFIDLRMREIKWTVNEDLTIEEKKASTHIQIFGCRTVSISIRDAGDISISVYNQTTPQSYPFRERFEPPTILVDGQEISLKEDHSLGDPHKWPDGDYYYYHFRSPIDVNQPHRIEVIGSKNGQEIHVIEYKP